MKQLKKLSKLRRRSDLSCYERPQSEASEQIFTEAEEYPSFFKENLVDPHRKIKIFRNNPHSNEQIFYFQLLKLIFEVEESQYDKYLDRIYELIDNPQFEFILPSTDYEWSRSLTDRKMKKLLNEFLELIGDGNIGVYDALNKYPIVDKILICFLRTMLIIGEKCASYEDMINRQDMFEFLANYFQIELTFYDHCIRFNDTDIFAYEERGFATYLAYIELGDEQESEQQLLSDEDEYHDFNEVKQMISEINIETGDHSDVDELSKNSKLHQNSNSLSQYVQYNYSRSDEEKKSKIQVLSNSIIKSQLMDQSSLASLSLLKSNKVLEKEILNREKANERKSSLNHNSINSNILNPNFSIQNGKIGRPDEFFQIKEVPFELENQSPSETPRQKLVSFGEQDLSNFSKQNIYRNCSNKPTFQKCRSDEKSGQQKKTVVFSEQTQKSEKQVQRKSLVEAYANLFKDTTTYNTNTNTNKTKKRQKQKKITIPDSISDKQNTQAKFKTSSAITQGKIMTLKSLYDKKSIKSIGLQNSSSEGESIAIYTQSVKSIWNQHINKKKVADSKLPTKQDECKVNIYSKYGYVNNNISKEFTSSFLIKQIKQPYSSSISKIKARARAERATINNNILSNK